LRYRNSGVVMVGIVKVDTLQNNAGTSSVDMDYVVNGTAKMWTRFDPSTNTEYDSLNQSSRTDDGTGLCTVNFTNSFNNAYHAGTMDNSNGSTPNSNFGANICSIFGQTTALTKMAYGYSGAGAGTSWSLYDYPNQKLVVHGDLA